MHLLAASHNLSNNADTSLRSQLIGAWKLVSYVETPIDGSAPIHIFGKNPKGIIMYTPDGYMSAQLMSETRKPFASGDWFNGTPEEYIDEASTYIAYSGRFIVDEKQHSLKHEMQVSLFPNWIGNLQPRAVSIEGNQLTLGTVTPIMSKGKKVMSTLIWERVEQN